MQFCTNDEGNHIRLMPDSPEQIARSVEMTGLRGRLHQVVEAAIARARDSQGSCQAARTGEVDSADEPPSK